MTIQIPSGMSPGDFIGSGGSFMKELKSAERSYAGEDRDARIERMHLEKDETASAQAGKDEHVFFLEYVQCYGAYE